VNGVRPGVQIQRGTSTKFCSYVWLISRRWLLMLIAGHVQFVFSVHRRTHRKSFSRALSHRAESFRYGRLVLSDSDDHQHDDDDEYQQQ